MAPNHLVEKRLTALEEAVDELRRQTRPAIASHDWLQQVAGSVTETEAFTEALVFGRQIREADSRGSESYK